MRVLGLLVFILLFGCATKSSYPVYYPVSSSSPYTQDVLDVTSATAIGTTTSPVAFNEDSCTFVPGHTDSSGNYISSAYNCPENSIYAANSVNSCSWVPSYSRRDGTVVSGYNRCMHNIRPASYTSSPTGADRPSCVTSYCGPVRVRGYYRKDGTYVRPHTRRRSR